jgi:perosamine synthetase
VLPRGVLDIGWTDLGFGLAACLRPGNREAARSRVEAVWSEAGAGAGVALCALSVRSGFDTLLTALRLPAGGEVLTSALTVEDMPRIITAHGLVAVPVDVDMTTLSVRVEDLERAVGPNTCAVLVAHLFGSRMPLDEVIAFARRHGLLVIEDCAQAYTGPGYAGHPESDVAMFSFGSIKTNTALGGALLTVRDPDLLTSMRQVQACQPAQERRAFLRKVVKHVGIHLVARPSAYGVLARACRALGTDHDAVISTALRGFSGPDFFARIRHQPSYPLLALLERRLRTFDRARILRRTRVAESALACLPATVSHVGTFAHQHSHWIFPVTSPAPEDLIPHLWARGFDATRGRTSLAVLAPPKDRPELRAAEVTETFSRVVYLPVHGGARRQDLVRLGHAVAEVKNRAAPTHWRSSQPSAPP